MRELNGKTAVVTGAASGMGRAFAKRFARAGMRVVLSDVEAPALEDALGEVLAQPGAPTGGAIAVRTDVSKTSDVEQLLATSLDTFGQVNVLCNNAGVAGAMRGGGFASITEQDWQWVLGVNLFGVIHGCRIFLPHLLSHGDGHIVNTASLAGLLGSGGPYGVSKFGVVALSEGLYAELVRAGSSVGISVLCPGFVSTRIMDSERNRPEPLSRPAGESEPPPDIEMMRQIMKEMIQSGRNPDEVADLVHDAILENRFYIFTTHDFDAALAERHRHIESGANPRVPDIGEMVVNRSEE